MPQLPDGDPAPTDGRLPDEAAASLPGESLSLYVHVPFCRVRCGYCDFNTYTRSELGGGASAATYAASALAELDLAAAVLDGAAPAVSTIFFGGGTPTLLPAAHLVRLVDGIRDRFGLTADAEITTEANPDSVDETYLHTLARGGMTRVSIGMQSAVPHVLQTLDRTHDPDGVGRAMAWAREAGLATSVDLIYGTPGESLADWQASLDAAVALTPDHISAYALTVEEGTALHRRVSRGELPTPTGDDEAEKYELADTVLRQAGFQWYEISNWATSAAQESRHNQAYWRTGNWWGIGPGAHSHVGGVRWWNVKHPRAYAARLASGASPAAAREVLTAEQQLDERILLGIRLREGLDLNAVPAAGRRAVAGLVAQGLVDGIALVRDGRVVLTVRGRLLADLVVGRLLLGEPSS